MAKTNDPIQEAIQETIQETSSIHSIRSSKKGGSNKDITLHKEPTPSRFDNKLARDASSDSSSNHSGSSRSSHRSDPSSDSSDSSSTDSDARSTRKKKHDASRKKEEQGRRDTIFSKPVKAKHSSKSNSNVLILKSITREHFPNVEFKTLNLEHICIFLDEYERILERHPDQGLRMIDFVNVKLHSRLTIAATDLKYINATTFGLGVSNLTDKQLKKCILHLVRAISAEDFIKKIKSIQFPSPETDRANFTPSAMTFNVLFDRATLYAHKFNRILQMIAMRAKGVDIPPLYKEGKTLGIIDYFLDAWPGGSGNALYAKLTINHNSLRHMKTFTEFTYKFFKVLKPYKKLREGVDDLDSLLSVRKRHDQEKPMHSYSKQRDDKTKKHLNHNVVHNASQELIIEDIYEQPTEDF
jgi:hypothetical protein